MDLHRIVEINEPRQISVALQMKKSPLLKYATYFSKLLSSSSSGINIFIFDKNGTCLRKC